MFVKLASSICFCSPPVQTRAYLFYDTSARPRWTIAEPIMHRKLPTRLHILSIPPSKQINIPPHFLPHPRKNQFWNAVCSVRKWGGFRTLYIFEFGLPFKFLTVFGVTFQFFYQSLFHASFYTFYMVCYILIYNLAIFVIWCANFRAKLIEM